MSSPMQTIQNITKSQSIILNKYDYIKVCITNKNQIQEIMDSNRDKLTPSERSSNKSRFLLYTQRSNESEEQQEYEQRVYGYTYGSIDYYDGKYHGKILLTTLQSSKTKNMFPPTAQIPHISKRCENPFNGKQRNKYIQYRHGPGILILDNNTWILTKWAYNKIAENKVYVMTGDYGIMQIHMRNKQSTNQQNETNSPRQQQIDIEQIVYVSTFSKKHAKNDQESVLHRYTIVGCKQDQQQKQKKQSGKQEHKNKEIWKWATVLKKIQKMNEQEKQMEQHEQYYMQTQMKDISINNKNSLYLKINRNQLISQDDEDFNHQKYRQQISQLIENNKETNPKKEKQEVLQRISSFSHYTYIINSIKQTLIQDQKGSKLGFHMIQKKQENKKTNNIIGMRKNETMTHIQLQTTIYSITDMNQSIYIKIFAQDLVQQKQGSKLDITKMRYKITQMSILNKYLSLQNTDILHKIRKQKNDNLNISQTQLFSLNMSHEKQQQIQSDKYYKVYDYTIKQIYFNKSKTDIVDMTHIRQLVMPNYQIEQRISNKFSDRYRYHSFPTTFNNSINKISHTYNSTYKKSTPYLMPKYPARSYQKDKQNHQQQCQKVKKQHHISSANFDPKYHTKLIDMINTLLCTLNTVYCQSRVLQIQTKMEKEIKKQQINKSVQDTNINSTNKNTGIPQIKNQISKQATKQDIKKQLDKIKLENKDKSKTNTYQKYRVINKNKIQTNKKHSKKVQDKKQKGREYFIKSLYEDKNQQPEIDIQNAQAQEIEQEKKDKQQQNDYLFELIKQYKNTQEQIVKLNKNGSPYRGYKYSDISAYPTTSKISQSELSFSKEKKKKSKQKSRIYYEKILSSEEV